MRSADGIGFTNINATPDDFELAGGKYGIAVVATWGGGSVQLQKVGPDGSTLLPVMTAFTDDGYVTADIPRGTYQLTIATATGIYASVERIPGE